MKIKTFNTSDVHKMALNVLIYGFAGCGKTTCLRYFQKHFGKGLILSGEGGLASVSDVTIDFIPFYSFGHEIDRDKYPEGYSFTDIMSYIKTDDFKKKGYKWIAVDSLTELSRRAMMEARQELPDAKFGAEFKLYDQKLDPVVNDLRDLPMHTVLTALATAQQNDDGGQDFMPMLHQRSKSERYNGLADVVACLIQKSETTTDKATNKSKTSLKRLTMTSKIDGWHGKKRDPLKRVPTIIEGTDVAAIVKRLTLTNEQFEQAKAKGINK
jgi:hypothetical protein